MTDLVYSGLLVRVLWLFLLFMFLVHGRIQIVALF